jgi:hypothetical protein
MMTTLRRRTACCALAATCVALLLAEGCQTSAQTGALGGAGIGALAGQAIGGSTGATLIGAGVGAGIGYMIGNEKDKEKAETMSAASRANDYDHTEVGPLGGTRWMMVSLAPRDFVPPYTSKIIDFRPDGHVITTTTRPDGSVMESNESYRVVGDTLIVNKPGYLINARFSVQGNQLVVSAEEFRAVLQRMGA